MCGVSDTDSYCLSVSLCQVSTLDGVLEVRNEHFWTVGFGSLVCDDITNRKWFYFLSLHVLALTLM